MRNLTREFGATRTSSASAFRPVGASVLIGILATAFAVAPVRADQKKWNTAGSLDCTMGPSIGLVMAGLQQGRCVFKPSLGAREIYIGRMKGPGVNLGIRSGAKLSWTVFVKTLGVPANSLAGSYSGSIQAGGEGSADGKFLLCHDALLPVCLRPVGSASRAKSNHAYEVAKVTLEYRTTARR